MLRILLPLLVISCVMMAAISFGEDAKDTGGADDAAALQGVWIAQSAESSGKAAGAEQVARMRFTFRDGKLFVAGNHAEGPEEECTYKIDPSQTPRQLDFTPPKEQKPILAIYEIKGDELKVCIRHGGSDKGRPTEFASTPGSELVLIVFKKQKA